MALVRVSLISRWTTERMEIKEFQFNSRKDKLMRTKLFIQKRKPWKPITWLYRNDPETDEIMCQGYKMFALSIFFVGFYCIWDEWDDLNY
jgi:hypothetical protein